MRLAEQKRRLSESSRVVVTLGDNAGKDGKGFAFDDLAKLVRPGTVVQLMYAFLLVDPRKKRARGGLKAEFEKVLSALVDKRKAVVSDVLTGLTTETPAKRLALIAAVHDQIARSNRGLWSAENGARSRGRPPAWAAPSDRQIIWEEWHSTLHRTNGQAADAASKRLGRDISAMAMWRVVKEERLTRGIDGKGASGRRPNVKALIVASGGKRRTSGHVYFIRNGRRKQIKIGFGVSYKDRIGTLSTSSPETLTVLATMPGDIGTERELHRRFAEYHIRREWFRFEGELAEFVAGLQKTKRK
jgi:hypothetical protein